MLTLQAVIDKTRDDGRSEAITSSRGEQRDSLHLDLKSRPFITYNSKAIRYRFVAAPDGPETCP
jgi:hypothetical protein